MTPHTPKNTRLFDRIFVAIAMASPILMVIVAGMSPQGSRGTLIVAGHEFLAAILALAVAVRLAYGWSVARNRANVRDRARQVGLMVGEGG